MSTKKTLANMPKHYFHTILSGEELYPLLLSAQKVAEEPQDPIVFGFDAALTLKALGKASNIVDSNDDVQPQTDLSFLGHFFEERSALLDDMGFSQMCPVGSQATTLRNLAVCLDYINNKTGNNGIFIHLSQSFVQNLLINVSPKDDNNFVCNYPLALYDQGLKDIHHESTTNPLDENILVSNFQDSLGEMLDYKPNPITDTTLQAFADAYNETFAPLNYEPFVAPQPSQN